MRWIGLAAVLDHARPGQLLSAHRSDLHRQAARSSLEFVESAFRLSGRGVFWLLSFPQHCAECPASPERPFFK